MSRTEFYITKLLNWKISYILYQRIHFTKVQNIYNFITIGQHMIDNKQFEITLDKEQIQQRYKKKQKKLR